MNVKNYWTEYWNQGCISSFGEDDSIFLKGINKHWQSILFNINSNSRILDLCTGNGFLIDLLRRTNPNFNSLDILGVDYASIKSKHKLSNSDNVEILDNTEIEKLPLKTNSYNCVISNFGLEYSNLSKSLFEISRVLKSKGHIELLCHCTNSSLIQNSKNILKSLIILKQKNIFSLIGALAENIDINNKVEAEVYRTKLNTVLSSIAEDDLELLENSQILKFLRYLLSPKQANKLEVFNNYYKEITAYILRLEQMIDSAIGSKELILINQIFTKNNIVINNSNEIYAGKLLLGIHISAIKM